ncbi:MAG: 2-oxo acid dehydrogenase subunit E2 [Patescibacteria group bacterium]
MARGILEITEAQKNRLGFYNDLPPDPFDIEIRAWFVQEGDVVPGTVDPDTGTVRGGNILSLLAQKGEKDIEAVGPEINARIIKILVPAGTIVSVDLRKEPLRLAEIELVETTADTPIIGPPPKPDGGPVRASPRTRRLAREMGVDLSTVKITGTSILREADLRDEKSTNTTTPNMPPSAYMPVSPTILQRTTAEEMRKAQLMPLAGDSVDVDVRALLKLREDLKGHVQKTYGLKLRLEHFFIASCAWLLSQNEFRALNARWYEEGAHKEIRLYKNVHIGLAISMPSEKAGGIFSGLATPTIRCAETLRFLEVIRETERLVSAAGSTGRLTVEDMSDPTFIINNVGAPVSWRGEEYLGGEDPHPLLISRIASGIAFGAVRASGDERRMRVAFRFDHRVMNGREPISFLRVLQHYLLMHPERIPLLK